MLSYGSYSELPPGDYQASDPWTNLVGAPLNGNWSSWSPTCGPSTTATCSAGRSRSTRTSSPTAVGRSSAAPARSCSHAPSCASATLGARRGFAARAADPPPFWYMREEQLGSSFARGTSEAIPVCCAPKESILDKLFPSWCLVLCGLTVSPHIVAADPVDNPGVCGFHEQTNNHWLTFASGNQTYKRDFCTSRASRAPVTRMERSTLPTTCP